MLEIYQELANLIPKGGKAVLATVISSQGSAPRKAGAKMLILPVNDKIRVLAVTAAEVSAPVRPVQHLVDAPAR